MSCVDRFPAAQPPTASGLMKLAMSCVAGDVWVALSCIGHLVRSAIPSDGCDILAFDLSGDAKDVFFTGQWHLVTERAQENRKDTPLLIS